MIVLIDNYDSFSYNLYQLVGSIDQDIKVVRNDAISVAELEALSPDAIILSPGPGKPQNAGICIEVVHKLSGRVPLLGVCLGHQSICEAFGGRVSHAHTLMHGKSSLVKVDTSSVLFKDLPKEIMAGRYHSLAALPESLPSCLCVTAQTDDGEIMAIEHASHPTFGVQFHPESIMTPQGFDILRNFMEHAHRVTQNRMST